MFEADGIIMQYIVPIVLAFVLATVLQYVLARLLHQFVDVSEHSSTMSLRLRRERQRTLRDLLASSLRFVLYGIALLFTMGLFIDTTTIVWMLGLFSAAFGLGARPIISDVMTGMSFIFEDTIDVGDKVEILEVQGVVEKINLRTMFVRATTGELYIIPNGEVRVIRNFSRGSFSTSNITLKVHAHQLGDAMLVLEQLGKDAVAILPNLLEPWQIINTSGELSNDTELTLMVKTRYGKGAESRPRLLKLIHEKFAEAGIELAD